MRSRGTGPPVALRYARIAASSLGDARPDVFLELGLVRRFLVFLLVAVRAGMGSTDSMARGDHGVDRRRGRVGHGQISSAAGAEGMPPAA